jgi:hypothetical protein
MKNKDFSILLEKIPSTAEKTDIAVVTGYNATVQKITHLFNTNKGELPSDSNFGSDYYIYLFDPVGNKSNLEANLANYIRASIPELNSAKVTLESYSETKITFNVKFSYFDGLIMKSNIQCTVEVTP